MELEAKECPYCGNIVMAGEGEEAEDVCTCAEAERRRDLKLRYDKLLSAAENCLGEECGKNILLSSRYPKRSLTRCVRLSGCYARSLFRRRPSGLLTGQV